MVATLLQVVGFGAVAAAVVVAAGFVAGGLFVAGTVGFVAGLALEGRR